MNPILLTAGVVAVMAAVLKQLSKTLPANPTLEQISAAIQPLQDRSDRVTARLEDALTELAGSECTLEEA